MGPKRIPFSSVSEFHKFYSDQPGSVCKSDYVCKGPHAKVPHKVSQKVEVV